METFLLNLNYRQQMCVMYDIWCYVFVTNSKRYTYPTLMRIKRGIFEASFDNGIHFAIRVPGVDWVKTIGTDALGASFGLVIRNELELELSMFIAEMVPP